MSTYTHSLYSTAYLPAWVTPQMGVLQNEFFRPAKGAVWQFECCEMFRLDVFPAPPPRGFFAYIGPGCVERMAARALPCVHAP